MGTRVWGEGQVGTRVCGGEGQVSTRVFQLPGLHRLLPLCLPLPYCSYQARTAFLPFCLPLPCCSYQDRTASLPSSPAAGTGSGSGDGSEGENVCLRTLCMFKHMNMHEIIVYSPRVPATRDLDLACPMPLLSVSPRVHP